MTHKPQRVVAQEFMDLGPDYYTLKEYQDMLYKLGTINALLGGSRATLRSLKKLSYTPKSILDVGCGAGRDTMKIARKYPNTEVVGIDIEQPIIDYAHQLLNKQNNLNNIKLEFRSSPQLNESRKYDVVMCTLVCHHMTDEQIIDFLVRARTVAQRTIIINDLHRHPLAIAAYALIAPLFNNRLITYDGTVSILRAFIRQDLEYYLEYAGFEKHQYQITWHWAFRWTITVNV